MLAFLDKLHLQILSNGGPGFMGCVVGNRAWRSTVAGVRIPPPLWASVIVKPHTFPRSRTGSRQILRR